MRDNRLTARFLAPKRARLHSPACDVAQLSLLVTMRHGPTKNRICVVTSILVRVSGVDRRGATWLYPTYPRVVYGFSPIIWYVSAFLERRTWQSASAAKAV